MKTIPRFLKMFGHAAALVFGAFWLVATSAENVPARDCFTGLSNPTKIAVVLGAPQPRSGFTEPSCAGIDGLAAGTTLIFSLSRGPRPEQAGYGACWSYDTQALDGVPDVQLTLRQGLLSSVALTHADGTFSSSTAPGCQGQWDLSLQVPAPVGDETVPPLDAPKGGWIVERGISVEEKSACGAAFFNTGPVDCGDQFPVVSITEVTP